MSLQFDVKISSDDLEIQKFLLDATSLEKNIEPILDNGFYYPTIYKKGPLFPEQPHEFEFPASESWYIYRRVAPWPAGKVVPDFSDKLLGMHKVNIILAISVTIQAGFYLSLRDGISENDCKDDIEKLSNYAPANNDIHEFENYIKANLNFLKEDDYIIKPMLAISKTSPLRDVDVRQRDSLRELFSIPSKYDGHINLLEGGDYSFSSYVHDNDVFLWPGDIEALDKTPIQTIPIAEVTKAKYAADPGALGKIISGSMDPFLDKLFPAPCGPLKRKEYKLMTFPTWPEFKLEWKSITIKIGCVHITISVPILRIRLSELFFYVYFSIFKDAKASVLKIAENCAIKAAIEGAVVGLILLNPGVALEQFQSSFKSCVISDIMSCIDGGLYTIKVVGNWS